MWASAPTDVKTMMIFFVVPRTYRAKEGNYCSFQKTAKDDLHSFGEGTVLRSKLCGKGDRIKLAKTEF